MSTWEFWFLAVYVALQVLVPLRHFLCIFLPGRSRDLAKSDRKHFSWTMKHMLISGDAYFETKNRNTGQSLGVYQYEDFLPPPQINLRPENTIQFAQFLAGVLHKESGIPLEDIEVRTYLVWNVNERGAEVRVDENVDLAREKIRWICSYPWIKY